MTRVYVALFVTFAALATVFIAFADRLAQAGISRAVYFLVLVPVGLGAAAFLDKALRATNAEWVAKLWFGNFRLGGAAAVFGMVVAAGVYVMSSPPPLQIVVRVLAPSGPVKSGRVILYAGRNSWTKEISSEGMAVFGEVSEQLRTEPVRLVAEVPGFEAIDAQPRSLPANGVVELSLRAAPQPTSLVAGTVLTADEQPLAGAWVDFEHGLARAQTDAVGHFRADLPRAPGTSVLVMVLFDGKLGHQGYYTVPNELTLRFKR